MGDTKNQPHQIILALDLAALKVKIRRDVKSFWGGV